MPDLSPEKRKTLCARLRELSIAVSDGNRNEFTMRVPAEPERDADLVLSRAAIEIERMAHENAELALLAGNNGQVAAAALDRAKKAEAERDELRKQIEEAPHVMLFPLEEAGEGAFIYTGTEPGEDSGIVPVGKRVALVVLP